MLLPLLEAEHWARRTICLTHLLHSSAIPVPKYSTTDWELGTRGFERKYPHRNKNIGVQVSLIYTAEEPWSYGRLLRTVHEDELDSKITNETDFSHLPGGH